MKSRIVFCSLLALSVVLGSCKKEEEAEAASTETAAAPVIPPVQQGLRTENYVQATPQANMPVQNMPQGVTQAQQSAPAKAGMNPAHGQPGHRCDIAVGAPLNSAPTKPATIAAAPQGQGSFTTTTIPTPTATPQPQTTGIQPYKPETAPTPVVTKPGMNPPHGQEGHRCDIAVGEPLNK